MPTSKDFTHMRMLFTLFRNVFNFNWLQQCKLRAGVKGAHVHQPMAWPVPHTCAQLFRPYWGSSVQCTCSRRVNERGRQMQSTSLFVCSFFFVTLQYVTIVTSIQDFFLRLEQSRMALLGWSLAASCLRKAASW